MPNEDNNDVFVAELVDNDLPAVRGPVKLTLDRTKEYIRDSGIDKMSGVELVEFLQTQSALKIALLGEQVIKLMEKLDNCTDYVERNSLTMGIATLTKAAAEIAEMRTKFEKSMGLGVRKQMEEFQARQNAPRELTAAEFADAYADAAQQTGTVPQGLGQA